MTGELMAWTAATMAAATMVSARTRRDDDSAGDSDPPQLRQHHPAHVPGQFEITDTVTAENREAGAGFPEHGPRGDRQGRAADGELLQQPAASSQSRPGYRCFNNDSPQYAEQRTWGIDHSM